MIRTAIAAALVAVAATGCTVTVGNPADKPTAKPHHQQVFTDDTTTTDAPTFGGQVFLATLRERPAVFPDSDHDLLGLGHTVCRALNRGVTWMGLVRVLTDTYSANDSGYLIGVSVSALCPEHTDDLPG